ncbi:MAG: polyprenyl synthetase family protein [Candidatus Omnitrophica bacterium]|jgi:geranylgeranyl diphosphate synthase type I|nr:polyprenyl synthetase family protein [Candidatus Omnitrophota bacterium]
MRFKIKKKIEQELKKFVIELDKQYSLNKLSPLLFNSIKEFILRDGKRVRPTLLVIGYLGFSKKIASGLYTSALSIELLHDFMLVHDDIIDKSDTRRNKPSMHKRLNDYLSHYKGNKFSGEDLAIVAGDVMYAMGLNAFLSINENKERKEQALKQLIEAALYTGGGEFIELIYGLKNIEKITRDDIYKIYDYKTATYTFAAPLAIGAILGGATKAQSEKLFQYGIQLGRAFQIKDDVLGMFADEKKIGKSTLTDLQEAKKTILIWYAYNHSDKKNKTAIKNILSKEKTHLSDLKKMRTIIIQSKALDYAKKEVADALKSSQIIIASSKIKPQYKTFLNMYSQDLLTL